MERPEDILGYTPDGAGEFEPTEIGKTCPPRGPLIRADRFNVSNWKNPQSMIKFMNDMRTVPIEAIDDEIVNDSYAVAVWLFRQYAIDGDAKGTASMEKWLNWAKPILNRKRTGEAVQSPGSVAFLPRNVEEE